MGQPHSGLLLSGRPAGLRQIGIWGGWKRKPPYKPHAPGIDICKQLGAKWVTGTPASDVERNGFKNVTEESLRQGMTNFLKAYADKGLLMIAQGNEPHGTGQVVLDNVRAYKANYEAVKAFDPNIEVIGTSVEPNEEYFKPDIKSISIRTTSTSTNTTPPSVESCVNTAR